MKNPLSPISRRAFTHSMALGTAACLAPDLLLAESQKLSSKEIIRTSKQPASSRRFPIYCASGSHRELGQQHGEQAKDHILAHLELLRSRTGFGKKKFNSRAMQFQPLLQKYCPHLISEIAGLGEGVGISYPEALATNIRGGLDTEMDGACTSYAILGRGTQDGAILSGQNADLSPEEVDLAYVLHLKPKDKPRVMVWTFGGMIGYHGMNSAGIGAFANALGGGPAAKHGLTHYPIKRMMLECSTLEQLLSVIDRVPLASNGNYMLNDLNHILDVEWTTEQTHRLSDNGYGFLTHTNHFICPDHANPQNFEQSLPDSFSRLSRMNELIRSRFGKLSVSDMKSFLRDTHNGPRGICRSDASNKSITAASIISEPAKRQMHVAVGYEQEAPFELYKMD